MSMTKIRGIEFYNTPGGDVMIKPLDGPVRMLTETSENRDFITDFMSVMIEFYPKAFKALSKTYSRSELNRTHFEYLIVSRFIKCNFGEYDALNPDIDVFGFFHFEEVKCPLRGECPLCGVVCKPEFASELTDREIEVLRLFVGHNSAEEVAEKLIISPNTAKNHLRNIHIKTGTHTLAELVEYWIKNNLK